MNPIWLNNCCMVPRHAADVKGCNFGKRWLSRLWPATRPKQQLITNEHIRGYDCLTCTSALPMKKSHSTGWPLTAPGTVKFPDISRIICDTVPHVVIVGHAHEEDECRNEVQQNNSMITQCNVAQQTMHNLKHYATTMPPKITVVPNVRLIINSFLFQKSQSSEFYWVLEVLGLNRSFF